MSEPSTETKPTRSKLKGCCLGGVALIGVLLVAMVGANVSASKALDARLEEARQHIAAQHAAQDAPRPLLLGEPVEGNAVRDYEAIEWVIRTASGDQLRRSWQAAKPALPPGAEELAEQLKGKKYDHALAGELWKHVDGGPAPSAAALAQFEAFRPLTRFLRDGVRRSHCDWDTELEKGAMCEIADLVAMRTAANLLAYEAHLAGSADEAARMGLDLVQFGDDLGRGATLIHAMIAVAVRGLGLRSLEHTLSRPDLDADAARLVLTTLGRAGRFDGRAAMASERTGFRVTILAMTGRSLTGDPADLRDEWSVGPGAALVASQGWWVSRELRVYDDFMERTVAAMELPYAGRGAASEALNAELERSWSIFAKLAVPNFVEAQASIDEVHVLTDVVRVLAAARLARLEEGAYPATIELLAPRLGGSAPADPFAPSGGPLRYAVEGAEVRCWSVYRNGSDEGGKHRAEALRKEDGDLVLVARAPE